MATKHTRYTKEQKDALVRRADEIGGQAACDEAGIHVSSLYSWRKAGFGSGDHSVGAAEYHEDDDPISTIARLESAIQAKDKEIKKLKALIADLVIKNLDED